MDTDSLDLVLAHDTPEECINPEMKDAWNENNI